LQAGLSVACAVAAASSVTSPKPIATGWRNGALERLAAPCDGTAADQPMAGIS
jgi:hypothetical protein